MRCPKCGKDIDESLFVPPLTYCPYCGQNLETSGGEEAGEEILFCPYCGKELAGKVKFCPYCGRELASQVTAYEDKQVDSKPADFEAEPAIEALAIEALAIEAPVIEASAIEAPAPKRRQDKLYKQWTKYADLSPEDTPSRGIPMVKPVREWINLQRFPVLYIVLGVCVVILFVGLVLLLAQSG